LREEKVRVGGKKVGGRCGWRGVGTDALYWFESGVPENFKKTNVGLL